MMNEQLKNFNNLVSQMRIAQKSYFNPSTPTREKQNWLRRSKALEIRVDQELITFLIPETKEQELQNQRLFS